jgi:hypothetical protein
VGSFPSSSPSSPSSCTSNFWEGILCHRLCLLQEPFLELTPLHLLDHFLDCHLFRSRDTSKFDLIILISTTMASKQMDIRSPAAQLRMFIPLPLASPVSRASRQSNTKLTDPSAVLHLQCCSCDLGPNEVTSTHPLLLHSL